MSRIYGAFSFWILVATINFVALPAFAQKFEVPVLTAPVMDLAGVVDDRTEQSLNNAIRELRNSGGTQITVLTVPSLGGVPIEQASIQVTDQWKLGTKKGDKGVLLLISMQDRKVRIEVGQGLEGDLPDAIAKRIVEDRIVPYMREGKTSEAVALGVASIAQYSDPNFDFASKLEVPPPISRDQQGGSSSRMIWLLFLLFFFFTFLRPRRRGVWFLPMGGGGFGGGGFGGGGGGGWSGGGGGFSGGGASGGW